MKTILLWDPRFPGRKPARLTLDDAVASAAVRSGVATAANPAEAGILSAGGALDPTMLTEVVVQHGYAGATVRACLPYSVVMVGAMAGIFAAIGTPIAGGVTPTPVPGIPTITFGNSAVNVTEGNGGTATAVSHTVTADRKGAAGPLTVLLSWNGTAKPAIDYSGAVTSVTIPANSNSITFQNVIIGNDVVDLNRTIIIGAALQDYPIFTALKTVTIVDDDVVQPDMDFTLVATSIPANMPQGTKVGDFTNVKAGVTPTIISPNDGSFLVAGDANNGWKLVRGLAAISAGDLDLTVGAQGASSITRKLTIAVASGIPQFVNPGLAAIGGSRIRQTMSNMDGRAGKEAGTMWGGVASVLAMMEPRLRFNDWSASNEERTNKYYMDGSVYASDGAGFDEMRRVWLPKLIASIRAGFVKIVIMDLSSNSSSLIPNASNPQAYLAEAKSIASEISAAGAVVIFQSMIERGVGAGGDWQDYPASPRYAVVPIDDDMKAFADADPAHFGYFDGRSVIVDTTAKPYNPLLGRTRDNWSNAGTHFSMDGALHLALAALPVVQKYLAPAASSDDSISGNLITVNADLAATQNVALPNFTGVVPSNWTPERVGPTSNSVITATKVTMPDGKTGYEYTVDRSAMAAGDVEGIQGILGDGKPTFTKDHWYRFDFRHETSAGTGWRAIAYNHMSQGTPGTGGDVRSFYGSLPPRPDGVGGLPSGEPATAPVKLTMRTQTALFRTFVTASVQYGRYGWQWDKGDGAPLKFTIWDLKVYEQPAGWTQWQVPGDTTVPAIANSATISMMETAITDLQMTSTLPGYWSIVGGIDAAAFTINDIGTLKPPTIVGSYDVIVRVLPYDATKPAVTKQLSITIAADPSIYRTNFAGTAPLGTNGDGWTLAGAASQGATAGLTNANGKLSYSLTAGNGAAWAIAPKRSDDWRTAILSVGVVASNSQPRHVIAGADDTSANGFGANHVGWGWSGSNGIRLFKVLNGTTTQIAAFDVDNTIPKYYRFKISRETVEGVTTDYVLFFQNGALLNKTAVPGGVPDTWNRSGYAGGGSMATVEVTWSNTSADRPAVENKVRLVPLTFAAGYATSAPASQGFNADWSNRQRNSTITVQTVTSTGPSTGTFVPDGNSIRGQGLPVGTYDYTLVVRQAHPDAANANGYRDTTITFTQTITQG